MSGLLDRIRLSSPTRFNRACALLALLFLLVTLSARLFRHWDHQDFPQYYMGGTMARLGLWNDLYPIPVHGHVRNPGFIEDSTLKPGYFEQARKYAIQDGVRFMQFPTWALICVPLSVLEYTHSYYVWHYLMLLCAWIIALQAGQIFEICVGKPSRAAGLIILLVACSPQAHRWVRVMNMSALMGMLFGVAILSLIRNRPARGAFAVWLGAVAKYATLCLGPLYVAMRQWRSIMWMAIFGAASLGITVLIQGMGPLNEYRKVIAPTLSTTNTLEGNMALQGFLSRSFGDTSIPKGERVVPEQLMLWVKIAQWASLLVILGLIFLRKQAYWAGATHVFAASGALVCWLLIFAPIFWEHYIAYTAPLWGWMIFEATRNKLRAAIVILIIAMFYVPTPVMFRPPFPEPFNSHILWGTILMLALCVERMARGRGDTSWQSSTG